MDYRDDEGISEEKRIKVIFKVLDFSYRDIFLVSVFIIFFVFCLLYFLFLELVEYGGLGRIFVFLLVLFIVCKFVFYLGFLFLD